ncbi:trace amine-associated receptor 4-like [Acanthopagrus schlegelii]
MEEDELCFPELNTSCRKMKRSNLEATLTYNLLSCITLLTVVLNLLVIISIYHFRQLHTPTNFLLLSLAVSDFLVGSLLMPVEILLTETCWMLGDLMCALYFLLPVIIVAASVGNMVLISVDRYVAICDPLRYTVKVTQRLAIICILLCWTCSVVYSIFLLYDNLKQPGRYNSCNGDCVVNITGVVDLVVSFIIPITVIIVLYMRIFVVAVSQARAMQSQFATVSLKTGQVKKSEMKAARTLGILVIVFVVCYSPYYCVSLVGHEILVGSKTEVFMMFLMYINSCLNPVIYALLYPWFKKTIRLIVTFQILQSDSHMANIL